MNDIIKKLASLAKEIVEEKGLKLFALVLREDAIVWDLLAAASWIDQDRKEALDYLVQKVQATLTKQELLDLSGIVFVQYDLFTIGYFLYEERKKSWIELNNADFLGVYAKKVYVFVEPVSSLQVY